MILGIAFDLAITNVPNAAQIKEIVKWLYEHHSDLSQEQVGHAFDLYTAGKLEVKAEPFNRLSKIFIGKVLAAYRRYVKVQFEMQRTKNEHDNFLALPEHIMTPEEMKQHIRSERKKSFEMLVEICSEKGELPIGWQWDRVFLHLYSSKLIPMDKKAIAALKLQAIKELKEENKPSPGKALLRALEGWVPDGEEVNKIRKTMFRIAVINYLRTELKIIK